MKKASSVNTNNEMSGYIEELEQSVHAALETYSNVHRGSGHNSMVTTHLFEQARDIIMDYLELRKNTYVLIFCSPRRADLLLRQLSSESYKMVSSREIGLSLGIVAMAIRKTALQAGAPSQTGGGTARLISREWIIWANAPDKFEAGTPAIINVIAFAKALLMIKKYGSEIFQNSSTSKMSATDILYHDKLEKYAGKELLAELKLTLIGRNMPVPTMEGIKTFINLDNSASTPTFEPIWNTFRHALSQDALLKEEVISKTRLICSDMVGAPLSKCCRKLWP
jgi:selenocysteine lyase/cysteine desulfurase